jgi:hypothetical protein
MEDNTTPNSVPVTPAEETASTEVQGEQTGAPVEETPAA